MCLCACEWVSLDDDTVNVRKEFDNLHDLIAVQRNYSPTSTRME